MKLVPFQDIIEANRARQAQLVAAGEEEIRQAMLVDLDRVRKAVDDGQLTYLVWFAGYKGEPANYNHHQLPGIDYATLIGMCEIVKETLICREFGHDDDPEG
jgi:hypothetical protein